MVSSKKLMNSGALFFALASIVASILNYVISIAVSWRLPVISYGELNVLFSLLFILAIPSIIVQTFASHIVSEKESRELESSILGASLVFSLLLCIPLLLISPLIADFLHTSSWAVMGIIANVFLAFPLAAWRGMRQGKKEWVPVAASLAAEVLLKFALTAILVFVLGYGVIAVLWAVNLGTFLGLCVIYRNGWGISLHVLHIKNNIRHFLHLSVGLSGVILLTNADILAVRHLLPEMSGQYGALSRLWQVILMGANIVVSIFLPYYIGHHSRQASTKRLFFLSTFLVFLGWSTLSVVYIFYAPIIITSLFWADYIRAAPLLGTLGLAYLLLSISSVIGNYLLSLRKYWVNLSMWPAILSYLMLIGAHHTTLYDFIHAFLISSSILFALSCLCLLVFWWNKDLQKNHLTQPTLSATI